MPAHHQSRARIVNGSAAPAHRRLCVGACLLTALAVLTLAFVPVGFASERDALPPGSSDATCMSECQERNADGVDCERACWVTDPPADRDARPVDWVCMTGCREKGGRHADCRSACRLPIVER
jgi:hypothetical protein